MMLKSGEGNIYMYLYNGTSCRLSWLMMYENHLCLLSQHGQLVYVLRWRLCWIPHGVGTSRSSCQASQWACPPWTRNLMNSLTASMRILHSRLSTLLHSRGAYTVMILVIWHRKIFVTVPGRNQTLFRCVFQSPLPRLKCCSAELLLGAGLILTV